MAGMRNLASHRISTREPRTEKRKNVSIHSGNSNHGVRLDNGYAIKMLFWAIHSVCGGPCCTKSIVFLSTQCIGNRRCGILSLGTIPAAINCPKYFLGTATECVDLGGRACMSFMIDHDDPDYTLRPLWPTLPSAMDGEWAMAMATSKSYVRGIDNTIYCCRRFIVNLSIAHSLFLLTFYTASISLRHSTWNCF